MELYCWGLWELIEDIRSAIKGDFDILLVFD